MSYLHDRLEEPPGEGDGLRAYELPSWKPVSFDVVKAAVLQACNNPLKGGWWKLLSSA